MKLIPSAGLDDNWKYMGSGGEWKWLLKKEKKKKKILSFNSEIK